MKFSRSGQGRGIKTAEFFVNEKSMTILKKENYQSNLPTNFEEKRNYENNLPKDFLIILTSSARFETYFELHSVLIAS